MFFKRKPKHIHDLIPPDATTIFMTSSGLRTHVTRKCRTCGKFINHKFWGRITPEMLEDSTVPRQG